ncbi:MAG TPA: aldolase/citrate lyase family protein [Solirubrobacteraceae bacterium]|jgi:2-keto-3-deoxy-L-rhamnonate aldolase RhmA
MSAAIPSRFRARVKAGEPVVGAFVNLGSALTAEIMAIAGYDWLVFDLEHGAGDEPALLSQLQAVSHTGVGALVRVEGVDSARVLHALDLGADGVLVPRVRSAEEAAVCVGFCQYAGSRGVARYNRSWHWGLVSRTNDDADAEVVCAVQIETAEALADVRAIAAVDGVDVLFVGPADLAQSLGLRCPPDDPRLLERVAPVAAAAREYGKAAGMLVGTIAQARAYRDLGFSFLGCGSDGSLLAVTAQENARQLLDLTAVSDGDIADGDHVAQTETRPA